MKIDLTGVITALLVAAVVAVGGFVWASNTKADKAIENAEDAKIESKHADDMQNKDIAALAKDIEETKDHAVSNGVKLDALSKAITRLEMKSSYPK